MYISHFFSNVNYKIKLQIKIYFYKYFKKYKSGFCTNSRLLLYIFKCLESRMNDDTAPWISFF